MKKNLLGTGIGFIILGIVFFVVFLTEIRISLNEPVDIFVDGAESVDDIKTGMAIETDMYLLMESFGSVTSTTKTNGRVSSTNKSYYYILPVFVGDEDTYYVAFKVSEDSKDLSKYNEIVDDTMAYLYGEQSTCGNYSIKISGGLHKLDKEGYEYMKDWFKDTEFFENDSDIDKYVLPYEFEELDSGFVKVIVCVCIGFVVLGVIFITIDISANKKDKKINAGLYALGDKTVAINGVEYYVAKMSDVNTLIYKGKNDKAKKVLMKTYKASDLEAQNIVDNWQSITSPQYVEM